MTRMVTPLRGEGVRFECEDCGLSYDAQAGADRCTHYNGIDGSYRAVKPSVMAQAMAATPRLSAVDCAHGVPINLPCGACGSVPLPTISDTLAERGGRYGKFTEHARITQNIKAAMADSPNWATLDPDMREAMEMIAHKAGRILNGDPRYHDSWHDIVGYTKLVADRLATSAGGG